VNFWFYLLSGKKGVFWRLNAMETLLQNYCIRLLFNGLQKMRIQGKAQPLITI